MIKCAKGQVRQLKKALRWKGRPEQRQRIQMVLLRESGIIPAVIETDRCLSSRANRWM